MFRGDSITIKNQSYMFGGVHDELTLDGSHSVKLVLGEHLVASDHQGVHVGNGAA